MSKCDRLFRTSPSQAGDCPACHMSPSYPALRSFVDLTSDIGRGCTSGNTCGSGVSDRVAVPKHTRETSQAWFPSPCMPCSTHEGWLSSRGALRFIFLCVFVVVVHLGQVRDVGIAGTRHAYWVKLVIASS